MIPDDELNPDMVDHFTNAPSSVKEVLAKMGAFAAWARMRWMYVDIVEEKGEYEVISPLDQEPEELLSGMEGMERALIAVKKLLRLNPLSDDILEWIDTTREFLRINDKRFPENIPQNAKPENRPLRNLSVRATVEKIQFRAG